MALRTATAKWEGNLFKGSGSVSAASGAFKELGVTWAARTEDQGGKTSPEELVAAAHAGCYCMALSNGLDKKGTPPQRLETSVTITFEKVEAGFRATKSDITVKGWVKGLDAAGFQEAAAAAKDGCPISNMMKGNVALSVTATLAT